MKLLYAGVDTLDFACTGALSKSDLERLQTAKELAIAYQSPVLTEIGPHKVSVQVYEAGRRGGYAYVFHTGPLGAVYAVKESEDTAQWNIFVSIRAGALAAYGYEAARTNALSELENMGGQVSDVSVSRVDFAMDFLAPGFVLDPYRFVAHPHTKVRPFWPDRSKEENLSPSSVFRGRHVESVTIGKMPGRQIIVYDKRRAAINKNDLFWFDVWHLDPKDRSAEVWRVEVRAGKRELKDKWQARSMADVDLILSDIVRESLQSIRYLAPLQSDSNVSRQTLDPIWISAATAAEDTLTQHTGKILPSRLREIDREKAKEIYACQITGNIAGLAVALGISDEDLARKLPNTIGRLIQHGLRTPKSPLRRGVSRARERLHFIS